MLAADIRTEPPARLIELRGHPLPHHLFPRLQYHPLIHLHERGPFLSSRSDQPLCHLISLADEMIEYRSKNLFLIPVFQIEQWPRQIGRFCYVVYRCLGVAELQKAFQRGRQNGCPPLLIVCGNRRLFNSRLQFLLFPESSLSMRILTYSRFLSIPPGARSEIVDRVSIYGLTLSTYFVNLSTRLPDASRSDRSHDCSDNVSIISRDETVWRHRNSCIALRVAVMCWRLRPRDLLNFCLETEVFLKGCSRVLDYRRTISEMPTDRST